MRWTAPLLLAGGVVDAPGATDPTAGTPCDDRVGGALITLQVTDDRVTFWSTDPAFIDTAAGHLANGTQQVPNFTEVQLGTDCDPQ